MTNPPIHTCVHSYVLDDINAFGLSDADPGNDSSEPDDLVSALKARSVELETDAETWLRQWTKDVQAEVVDAMRKAESPRRHYKVVIDSHGPAKLLRVTWKTNPIVMHVRVPIDGDEPGSTDPGAVH